MTIHELVDSTPLLAQPDALRERFDADGCVFLRGLLPQDDVLKMRRRILEACRDAGWLEQSGPLMEGRANLAARCSDTDPAFFAVYDPIQRMEPFHGFAHHAALLHAVATLVNEPIFAHPVKVARMTFPQHLSTTTPAHQDYVFVQGTIAAITAWLPLGDCPRELGGLKIARATHYGKIYEHHLMSGSGGMGIDVSEVPDDWYSTDYRTGDVLLFHSLLVHQGLPNLTDDRLRLSCDFRYQAISQPVAGVTLARPHSGRLSWEEVYQDWQSEALQYYWKQLNLEIAPYDPQYAGRRNEEAFLMAKQGNPIARPILMKLARATGTAQGERARAALAELDTHIARTTSTQTT